MSSALFASRDGRVWRLANAAERQQVRENHVNSGMHMWVQVGKNGKKLSLCKLQPSCLEGQNGCFRVNFSLCEKNKKEGKKLYVSTDRTACEWQEADEPLKQHFESWQRTGIRFQGEFTFFSSVTWFLSKPPHTMVRIAALRKDQLNPKGEILFAEPRSSWFEQLFGFEEHLGEPNVAGPQNRHELVFSPETASLTREDGHTWIAGRWSRQTEPMLGRQAINSRVLAEISEMPEMLSVAHDTTNDFAALQTANVGETFLVLMPAKQAFPTVTAVDTSVHDFATDAMLGAAAGTFFRRYYNEDGGEGSCDAPNLIGEVDSLCESKSCAEVDMKLRDDPALVAWHEEHVQVCVGFGTQVTSTNRGRQLVSVSPGTPPPVITQVFATTLKLPEPCAFLDNCNALATLVLRSVYRCAFEVAILNAHESHWLHRKLFVPKAAREEQWQREVLAEVCHEFRFWPLQLVQVTDGRRPPFLLSQEEDEQKEKHMSAMKVRAMQKMQLLQDIVSSQKKEKECDRMEDLAEWAAERFDVIAPSAIVFTSQQQNSQLTTRALNSLHIAGQSFEIVFGNQTAPPLPADFFLAVYTRAVCLFPFAKVEKDPPILHVVSVIQADSTTEATMKNLATIAKRVSCTRLLLRGDHTMPGLEIATFTTEQTLVAQLAKDFKHTLLVNFSKTIPGTGGGETVEDKFLTCFTTVAFTSTPHTNPFLQKTRNIVKL